MSRKPYPGDVADKGPDMSDAKDKVVKDPTRRKELGERYKQTHPGVRVYRILNRQTNKALPGSTSNLASVRNKREHASPRHPGCPARLVKGGYGPRGVE